MFSIKQTSGLLNLCNGDSMTQSEFHQLYERALEGFRAELLNGVVYVCEALETYHAERHALLSLVLLPYRAATNGLNLYDNVSVILDDFNEVQPDLSLCISPEFGGQSRMIESKTKETYYIGGAPELIVEIAHNSHSIDLNQKKARYLLSGVAEYIVVCVEPSTVFWFDFRNDMQLSANAKGIIESKIFPGLWIDEQALLTLDFKRALKTSQRGLKSAEYKRFAASMSERV